ncbi:MAG: hypothetical protein EON90_02595 [Brevundimonas sp.]|nr:MAG: hypothetical protein EON90_02595 [Brevundimonas sp.]
MTDATPVDDVIVIGKRKKKTNTNNPQFPQMVEVEEETGDTGGGGGELTPADQAENERQKECAAKKFKEKLQSDHPFQKKGKEFFSSIFERDGDTVVHPPVMGTGTLPGQGPNTAISGPDIAGANATYGVAPGSLLGFVHNHPSDVYCGSADSYTQNLQRLTNQYPSEPDWAAADVMVSNGDPNTFVLYIVGCDNELRAFPYRDREEFKAERAKTNPKTHPPVQPQGCEG